MSNGPFMLELLCSLSMTFKGCLSCIANIKILNAHVIQTDPNSVPTSFQLVAVHVGRDGTRGENEAKCMIANKVLARINTY